MDKGDKDFDMEQIEDYKYPLEKLIKLNTLSDFLVGRVTIYKNEALFDAQIDIVQVETGKIYNHVGRVFGQDSEKEVSDLAYMKLKLYLNQK